MRKGKEVVEQINFVLMSIVVNSFDPEIMMKPNARISGKRP
jgi:hypothetical protein